ncbi:MAG: redox-regulated ATPase YchF [Acidobacteriota bacterium]
MKFTLFGLPKTGKTTLFNLLTGSRLATGKFTATEKSAHVGRCLVQDPRLKRLNQMFNPKRLVFAQIDYVDLGGLAFGEVKETELLPHLRNSDGLAHVVRAFEDEDMAHPGGINPVRDMEQMEDELILADMIVIESRLDRLAKDLKKAKRPDLEKEESLLQQLRETASSGRPLRDLALNEEEERVVRGFQFLSRKPLLNIVNVGEKDTGRLARAEDFRPERWKGSTNAVISTVSAVIEEEISELSEEETAEYLHAYGLHETALARLIRDGYALLGLISFFTVGDDEVRAWTVDRGTTAKGAAGAVHTDLEKGFIRAEVVAFGELLEAGSLAECRRRGTLRLEGKDYVVRDGEIVHIRSGI